MVRRRTGWSIVRVVQKGTNNQVPVRIHFHGANGEYLPPRGRHRKVNPHWFEDNYGEFVNGRNQYSYIDGHCEVDMPLGEIYVEITKGYETAPIRKQVTIASRTRMNWCSSWNGCCPGAKRAGSLRIRTFTF